MKTLKTTLISAVSVLIFGTGYAQVTNQPNVELRKLKSQVVELEKQVKSKEDELAKFESQVIELKKQVEFKEQETAKLKRQADTKQTCRDEIAKLQADNNKLAEENAKLGKILDALSEYPLIINSLKIGNVDKSQKEETKAGEVLYSSSSMYLAPYIEYTGLTTGETVTLYLKLYQNGILKRNAKSPEGYTEKRNITVYDSGARYVGGWGGETKGYWPNGSYRYEVWYNNMCLKAVDFTLH